MDIIRFDDYNNVWSATSVVEEFSNALSGCGETKRIQKQLNKILSTLDSIPLPDAIAMLSTEKIEPIDNGYYAIRLITREKNIRILFTQEKGVITILLCAFQEKKKGVDYRKPLETAKERYRQRRYLQG